MIYFAIVLYVCMFNHGVLSACILSGVVCTGAYCMCVGCVWLYTMVVYGCAYWCIDVCCGSWLCMIYIGLYRMMVL